MAVISFILQVIVKILTITAKVAVKTAQVTAKATKATVKAAKKTGETAKKVEKSTRKARKATKKVVQKTGEVAKKGVSTAKRTSEAAIRGAKNVSNTAKTTMDLASSDEEKRDTALNTIKNKTKNGAKGVGRGVRKGITKLITSAPKVALKILKAWLLFLRICTSCLAIGSMIWTCFCILLVGSIVCCVAYGIYFSGSGLVANATQGGVSGNTVSSTGSSTTSSTTGSTTSSSVSSTEWQIIYQTSDENKSIPYSQSSEGGRGTVGNQGCGLCSLIMVSEHYSGNKGTYTVKDGASEIDEKFPDGGTNLDPTVIPWWFNTKHTELGLTCTAKISGDFDLDELDKVLASGGCAIVDYHPDVKYNNKSVWTNQGHYVTITGGNQSNGYTVRDSNSGHDNDISTGGIKDWKPYNSHVFGKDYIKSAFYYYYITKK